MRFLMIIMLIFLVSCSKNGEDTISSPAAKLHSKLWYHKNSFDYNLKGPVREVLQTKYKVEGDSLSYQITVIDAFRNAKGDKCLRFNRDGYLTYVVNCERYNNYPEEFFNTTIKQFHFNHNNVLVRTSQEESRIVTNGDSKKQISNKKVNHNANMLYRGDTIKAVSDDSKQIVESMVMKITDSSVLIQNMYPKDAYTQRITFFGGDDSMYYIKNIEKTDSKEYSEYEFRNNQLQISKSSIINPRGDTTFYEYRYNSNRDYVYSRENNTHVNYPDYIREYRYVHDEYNNWIERVTFVNGKAKHAVCREITYW